MSIEVTDVVKSFEDFKALEGVSLEVPDGSLTALLGPSGSGKSTLLRIVAGLELPDSGTVVIEGADVSRVRPQNRGIGFVFQHYAAFTHMSVRDNVAFGLQIRKRPKAATRSRGDELLGMVGLIQWGPTSARLSSRAASASEWLWLGRWPWSQGGAAAR